LEKGATGICGVSKMKVTKRTINQQIDQLIAGKDYTACSGWYRKDLGILKGRTLEYGSDAGICCISLLHLLNMSSINRCWMREYIIYVSILLSRENSFY